MLFWFQKLKVRPGAPVPLMVNSKLQEDLSFIRNVPVRLNESFPVLRDNRKNFQHADQDIAGRAKHAQGLQELLLVLAICNTVVVSKHPHYDVVSDIDSFSFRRCRRVVF